MDRFMTAEKWKNPGEHLQFMCWVLWCIENNMVVSFLIITTGWCQSKKFSNITQSALKQL